MTHVNYDRINELAPLAQAGDREAEAELLQIGYCWTRMIIARKSFYAPAGHTRDDLIQAGVLGLAKAIHNWNPSGRWFSFYAEEAIEGKLIEFLKGAYRQKHKPLNTAHSLNLPAYNYYDPDVVDDDRLSVWVLPDPSGLGVNPGELVANQHDAPLLMEAFKRRLSAMEITALERIILGDESYQAVAAEMGLEWKAMDNAVQRARRKCSEALVELAADPRLTDETRNRIKVIAARVAGRWRRTNISA